jgi:hypothetical protein
MKPGAASGARRSDINSRSRGRIRIRFHIHSWRSDRVRSWRFSFQHG